MASILPTPDEYAALAPRPGSPVHRAFSDARLFAASGYAVLLQVAHPTVGAGVHQYSSFTVDPWGRLLRTLDYVHGTVSGGPELAGSIGARVRNLHKTIKGQLPDGSQYSAMEPGAFAWVHATLAISIIDGHRQFARTMTPAEQQAFWTQWRDVGRLVGVRPRDLPESVGDFELYVHDMVRDTLVWTPAVDQVMGTPSATSPPVRVIPAWMWRAFTIPATKQFHVLTTGLLPPVLRERLRLPYSSLDAALFRTHALASKASQPLIRGPLADVGTHYVRRRRRALERGDVAGAAQKPIARRAA
jgi:uncharacterized protein (DUF2236 family)